MTTRQELVQFDALNFLIREQKNNYDISGEDMRPELIRSLTRQAPHRIYCNKDGRIARIFMFSEERLRFRAFMETIDLEPIPREFRSQTITCVSPKALEEEIGWWKNQFGVREDLLVQPKLVLRSLNNPNEFVHLSNEGPNPIYCGYHISSLRGPRITSIGKGLSFQSQGEVFVPQSSPPQEIINYSNPYLRN